MIVSEASLDDFRDACRKFGMRTLREAGPEGDPRRPDLDRGSHPRDDARRRLIVTARRAIADRIDDRRSTPTTTTTPEPTDRPTRGGPRRCRPIQYEAMDHTGREVKDTIDASTQEEAQQLIRQKGFFVTKISERTKAEQEGPTAAKKGGPAARRSRSRSARSRPSSSARSPASSRRSRTPACRSCGA